PSASSTAAPSAPPTAAPSGSSTASASLSTTPDSTTPAKLPAPSSPCKTDSCGSGSSCVNLHNEYFCLCPVGQYYKNSTCTEGDIFPGTITVKINGSSDLENESSEAYQQLYNKVTLFFQDAFAGEEYGQTVILKISLSPSARSEMRAGENNVEVTVVNIFAQGAVDEKVVDQAIQKAVEKTPHFEKYKQQNLCEYYGCVDDGKGCRDNLQCTCKPGLERPNPQVPICVAVSTCPGTCTAEHHKQCLWNTKTNTPVCTCLPGYKNDSNGLCQKCSFGYSGINCEDQFQLILTIVGSIAGILILGMVIALIFVVRSKNKNKNIEKQRLIEDDFSSMRLRGMGVSNFGADGNIFPKVRTGVSKSSQPQNPYVNSRQMPRPDY
ncbi:mucin-13, partial [Talpa occidentalis]|uniref:mucin-13 n=1 Tax=Talpa occidentalis TaxID=50954 RepID=UPI00188F8242